MSDRSPVDGQEVAVAPRGQIIPLHGTPLPRSNLAPCDPHANGCTTIAVVSGKGGVGKTTLAVNLAVCLAGWRRRVTLVDADLDLANADLMLGVNPPRTLADVMRGQCTMDQLPIQIDAGLRFVGGASGDVALSEISAPDRRDLVRKVLTMENSSEFLFLDCGAGIGGAVLDIATSAAMVLVVTFCEPTAITDAYAIIKVLIHRGYMGSIRLLVNQAHGRSQADVAWGRLAGVTQRFQDFKLANAGWVLHDTHAESAVRERVPLVRRFPRSPSSLCIVAAATRLARSYPASHPAEGWLSRMAEFLG